MAWHQVIDGLVSWTIDYESQELRVVMADGRAARSAWKPPQNGPLDFKQVSFFPDDLVLEMVTPLEETLEVEVYAEDDQQERRRGRPVIYLDENKWIS